MLNRQFKDTVFRDLFGMPERACYTLDLHNSLSGVRAADVSQLTLCALPNAMYKGLKSDVAFLVGKELVLWEHQSTWNPNMPLRGLHYFGQLYSRIVEKRKSNVYGSSLVELPAPRYFVFYNGTGSRPDREELRLSDAFGSGVGSAVELRATVLNINVGHNAGLMERCGALAGYARLVELVREEAAALELGDAIDAAVARCMDEGVLVDYLRERKTEVRGMLITEYDEERVNALFREEGRREGVREGRMSGLFEVGRNLMAATGADAATAMEQVGIPASQRASFERSLRVQ